MKRYVVIVAGGKGTRMGGDVPKQFLPIGGRPVLMRTLERFHEFDPEMHLVVVLPADQQDYWRALCERYHLTCPMPWPRGVLPVSTLRAMDWL